MQQSPLAVNAPVEKKQTNDTGTAVILLLVSAAALIFYVYPQYKQWQADKQSAAAVQRQIDELADNRSKLSGSINKIDASQNQIKLLDLAIPEQPQIPDLYADLEVMAKASNLQMTSIDAQDESAPSPTSAATQQPIITPQKGYGPLNNLGVIDVRMELRGPLDQFKTFIGALESSMRFMDVRSVTVRTIQNFGLGYTVEMRTYYQMPPDTGALPTGANGAVNPLNTVTGVPQSALTPTPKK